MKEYSIEKFEEEVKELFPELDVIITPHPCSGSLFKRFEAIVKLGNDKELNVYAAVGNEGVTDWRFAIVYMSVFFDKVEVAGHENLKEAMDDFLRLIDNMEGEVCDLQDLVQDQIENT